MPALTKKRPAMESEPGEGKAHEMKESPEEEVREGSESEEGHYGKTNRKRSTKGAKKTKAPMDSDCGCGGGKGKPCTCKDSGCGDYKKMDSALTPQEYLAACDLGIQGCSRSYIRARLDAAERLDKKCGASGIAENKKCKVGGESAASGLRGLAVAAGATLAIGGAAAGIAAAHTAHKKAKRQKATLQAIKDYRNAGNVVRAEGRQTAKYMRSASAAGLVSGSTAKGAEMMAQAHEEATRSVQRSNRRQAQSIVREASSYFPKSAARKRRASRSDVYADGFSYDAAIFDI